MDHAVKSYVIGAKTRLWEEKTNGKDIPLWNSDLTAKTGVEMISSFNETDEYTPVLKTITQLLQEYTLTPKDIDGIFSSSTWTYDVLPWLAHVLGARLWLENDKPRTNIGSACTGAVHALYYANEEMKKRKEHTGKDQHFLIIAADLRSKIKDPATMPMLSDSAWVMLISTKKLSREKPSYEIWEIKLKNTYADESKLRVIEQKHHQNLTMPDGAAVYKFAVNAWKEIFDELVKTDGGVVYYVPHNANIRIVDSLEQHIWDQAKVWKESIKQWNLGWASVIHGLEWVLKTEERPDSIILWAFWANLEYGGVALKKAAAEEEGIHNSENIIENKNSIIPDLSFAALKNSRVWNIDQDSGGKEIALDQVNESLVGYEYESPKLYISSELVDFFTAIVGDYNPHYQESFARQTQLWAVPVPWALQQSLITNQAVIHHALKVAASNHIVAKSHFNFRKPVLKGDHIHYRLKVVSAKHWLVEREIRLFAGEEEKWRWIFQSYYQKKG